MRKFYKYILCACLMAGMMIVSEGVIWGSHYYYATVTGAANPEGGGTVYVSEDAESYTLSTAEQGGNGKSDGDYTFYIKAVSNAGYHFNGWTIEKGKGRVKDEGDLNSNPDTIIVKTPYEAEDEYADRHTTSGNDGLYYCDYTAKANFAENFYTRLTASASTGGSGAPTVSPGEYQNSETAGTAMSYTVTAQAASSGYHFQNWTVTNGTATSSTTASPLTVNVKASSTGGSGNATNCTVKANYAQNVYYANLTAQSGGNGTVSVTSSPMSTTTSGGDVEFGITATAESGYHFKQWTVTTGNGTFGDSTSASTTFTAAAATSYDLSNATEYVVTAEFEKDVYYARLDIAQASGSDYGSSTIQVSADNINWSDGSATAGSETASADVSFYLKAAPAAGYKFLGWKTSDSSVSYVSTDLSCTYTVTSSSSQGGTSTSTVYAVFRKVYTISVTANGLASGDKAVFSISGPQTYRISLSNGETATLKDVTAGSYVITPSASWTWNYSFTPADSATSWDSENKSSHTFTFTTKGSSAKNVESHATIEP